MTRGIGLHFSHLGPVIGDPIDTGNSPIVAHYPARIRRGVLWTVGEVHFLSTSARFPELNRVARAFRTWLSQFVCVFDRRCSISDWDYFLEGSVRNFDSPIFALPSAMRALQAGQYFVADDDTDAVLDKLCRSLRLRGVEGITPDP